MLAFLFTGCKESSMVLELDYVQDLQVNSNNKQDKLNIKGLCFHSALAIDKITTERQEKRLVIKVHLAPARSGLSGSFNYDLDLPLDVTKVVFGNEEKVIWKRLKQ
jgi:hypothetical protein